MQNGGTFAFDRELFKKGAAVIAEINGQNRGRTDLTVVKECAGQLATAFASQDAFSSLEEPVRATLREFASRVSGSNVKRDGFTYHLVKPYVAHTNKVCHTDKTTRAAVQDLLTRISET